MNLDDTIMHESAIIGPPVSLVLEVNGDVIYDENRIAFVVVEQRRVLFTCSFLADPRPNVVWLRNGEPINTSNPQKYTLVREYEISERPIGNFTETLTIIGAVLNDTGSYTCAGSNTHGDTRALEMLEVIG
jgi:hypothetical protein